MIHSSAIIDPSATIGSDVSIGAYAIVKQNTVIGDGCIIENHSIVGENTTLGKNNRIFPFASIGLETQDKKKKPGDQTRLIIGDNNVFREYCTVNRGTKVSGGQTLIGSDNLFLAYTHVAHDCILGNHIVMSNNATLGGHVEVGNCVIISGFVAVHQFCRIGDYAFVGLGGMLTRDVPPYLITSDVSARVRGINRIGLKRNDFSDASIKLIYRAYQLLYPKVGVGKRDKLVDIISKIKKLEDKDGILQPFIEFIKTTERGLCL
jgi:UDP-N-acetylglucosamine acyltransferase